MKFINKYLFLVFILTLFFSFNRVSAAVPSAITTLKAGSLSGAIELNWTAPSATPSITDYDISYRIAGNVSWINFADGVSTSNTATVTGLTNNTNYQFRVRAINTDGTASDSNIAEMVPLNLTFSDNFESLNLGTISGQNGWVQGATSVWSVVDSSGNKVVRGDTSGECFNINTINQPVSGGYTNARLKVDFKHIVNGTATPQLWLRKQGTSGDPGGYITFRSTDNKVYIQEQPNAGGCALYLRGTASTVALTAGSWYTAEYEVITLANGNVLLNSYMYPQGGTRGNPVITYTETALPYYASGVSFGLGRLSSVQTEYDNLLFYSNVVLNTPSSPLSLSSASTTSEQINLSWSAPLDNGGSAITDYIVEYSLSGNDDWNIFADSVSTSTSAIVTGLVNETSYDFRVKALNANGSGSYITISNITPHPATAPVASNVSISGTLRNGVTLSGNGTFSDINGDAEATSTFRWLRGDTLTGSFTPISGATSDSYTLQFSDVGRYIKFEYTPVSSSSPTTGVPEASLPSGPILDKVQYWHLLLGGQSLSTGYGATPILNSSSNYDNLMPSGGLEGTSTTFDYLYETGAGQNGSVETPASGISNAISDADSSKNLVMSINGTNGAAYTTIKKGTSLYNKGITQATNAKSAVENDWDGEYTPKGVVIYHGETDWLNNNSSSYESYLAEWQRDYQSDLNSLVGSNSIIPLFINQMNSVLTGEIGDAQLASHVNNPGKVILTGPKYQFPYAADRVHLTNTGSLASGELMGKVIKKVLFDGQTWNPLMPESLIRNGSQITISFNVPVAPLVIDTTLVAERTNYGFVFEQTGGNSISINSVSLNSDQSKVIINLSDTPTGTDQRIKYAWSCPVNPGNTWCGGPSNNQRVGGNIRDSDEYYSTSEGVNSGIPLYNWLVSFNKPVTEYVPVSNSMGAGSVMLTSDLNKISNILISQNKPSDTKILLTRFIQKKDFGDDVKLLQEFLNKNGFIIAPSGYPGSLGKETKYFGNATWLAVKKFQKQYGITPVNGRIGPKTKAKINELLSI